MLDMFRDVWQAMTPEQQKGISWIALKGDRVLGESADGDMMALGIAAVDVAAKHRSENYGEYREQVIAICQGMAKGLLDGGIDFYLKRPTP